METSFLGGFVRQGEAADTATQCRTIQQGKGDTWCAGGVFVRASEACCRLFTWDSLALVVRGTMRTSTRAESSEIDRMAEEIRSHYLEHGKLSVHNLEGSFSLALLDGQAGRVILYRNLVGTGFTYYCARPDGIHFGSNLAMLVDAIGDSPRVNQGALPTFFIGRFVPGRETLFDGIYRLLPGEQVSWATTGMERVQRQTFGSLVGDAVESHSAVAQLETTMDAVLGDCVARDAGAVNLLSGGVDSSYLQVVWNRLSRTNADLPTTYSISVDHPRTWPDTDYAMSASALLGTRHRLVPANGSYANYLLDLVSSTGEPPNHVQSAYFGHLAGSLVAAGHRTAICGEGADSLFGLGLANQVHNARLASSLIPLKIVRQCAAAFARLVRSDRVGHTLWLADHAHAYTDDAHPINRAAIFTDWSAVEACFGNRSVQEALVNRRSLLDHFDVPQDPMHRLHAIGYLAEATDSASLWTTLFNCAGADLSCPFLDSRLLRFVVNLEPGARFPFRRPKALLKAALVRNGAGALAHRSKLGFGQPIFEWLAPGGQLRRLVEQVGNYDFVDRRTLQSCLACPNWFLYSLLCYDLWYKLFIERSLPRARLLVPAREAGMPAIADAR